MKERFDAEIENPPELQPCWVIVAFFVKLVVLLTSNTTYQEFDDSYPSLTPEAIQAAMAYAAELARERVVTLPA